MCFSAISLLPSLNNVIGYVLSVWMLSGSLFGAVSMGEQHILFCEELIYFCFLGRTVTDYFVSRAFSSLGRREDNKWLFRSF